jgi:hypothetical protein
MSGGSIETTLELWAASLRDIKARMRPLFTQTRVAASAGLFLDGLLGDERTGEGQELSGRHRILGQCRADPAVIGEVEDQRSCQNPLSPAAVEARLSRGIIQQEQQQILGDTCHGRRMN